MTVQEIGVALVIVGFCAWLIAWVGLASYGLVWLPRDLRGASVSIAASVIIFLGGLVALTQTPGGF